MREDDFSAELYQAVEAAAHPDGDVAAAQALFAEHGDKLPRTERLWLRAELWRLTGDRAHVDEANRLLDFMVEHAPEEDRESMIENVPLHRDIMAAWEAHGATS